MDYSNYDSDRARPRSFNQSPYLRPQDNNVGMHGDLNQRRHGREHNAARYVPDNMAVALTPRPTFLQPPSYTSLGGLPASPQLITPHTPYYATGTADHGMMAVGSPVTPGHYPMQQFGFYPGQARYQQYSEPEDMEAMSSRHEYTRQQFGGESKSYAHARRMEFKPFLGGPMQFESSPTQERYDVPNGKMHVASTASAVEMPPAVVEQVKFSNLTIHHGGQVPALEPRKPAPAPEPRMTSVKPAPVLMSKTLELDTAPETTVKKSVPKLRTLTGPIEKAIKWDAVLGGNENENVLYEIIAPFVAVRPGTFKGDKMILLREPASPALQCFFQEVDVAVPAFHQGQLVRCVGKMTSKNKLRAFSVRGADPAEKTCHQRLQFICNRLVNEIKPRAH